MTDLCDPSSGDDCRNEERDAPAIADMPSIRRWLRALSILRLWPALRSRRVHKRQRIIRLHLMNAYLLKDMGLERVEDEERLRPLTSGSLDKMTAEGAPYCG
jgi:hypothetical protein